MARDANGRYVDDDDYYGVSDRAAYGPSPDRVSPEERLRREVTRLRGLVDKAVGLGFELEGAYEDNAQRFHNVNDWEDAEHERVQAARNALGAVLVEMAGQSESEGKGT